MKNNINTIIEGYGYKDLFNCHETELHYECLPDQSLIFKSDDCHSGKYSEVRVAVLLTVYLTGTDKMTLLVIRIPRLG